MATESQRTFRTGGNGYGFGINDSGQVAGWSNIDSSWFTYHAYRTAPNSVINSATDDLGTLGGSSSFARGINASGQVAGYSALTGDTLWHAFRTAPNSPINPATDDLGTLGGTSSGAYDINEYGEVVGHSYPTGDPTYHAFVSSSGALHDLNNLIPASSNWMLFIAYAINDAGQIAGLGIHGGNGWRAFLLTPVYKAFVQQPIKTDGKSVFSANRAVVPVKFRLTQQDIPTCTLPAATISVTRTAGATLGSIDANTYLTPADIGSDFRVVGYFESCRINPILPLLGMAPLWT